MQLFGPESTVFINGTEEDFKVYYFQWGYLACSLLSLYNLLVTPVELVKKVSYEVLRQREFPTVDLMEDYFFDLLAIQCTIHLKGNARLSGMETRFPPTSAMKKLKDISRYCQLDAELRQFVANETKGRSLLSGLNRFNRLPDQFLNNGKDELFGLMKELTRALHFNHDLSDREATE
jgi:hypothetical protein